MAERFLYRGTTRGWPGGEALRIEHKSPTSTDPLVATLFAIECCRHGEAVVYVAPLLSVVDLIVTPNCMSELECEIVLGVLPAEFESSYVRHSLPAQSAREALERLGFSIPVAISSVGRLIDELEHTPRLTAAQVIEFNSRMMR